MNDFCFSIPGLKQCRSLFKQLCMSCLDLLYPPLCLHCREALDAQFPLFCHSCLSLLEMIDHTTRCPYCFTTEINIENGNGTCCSECRQKPHIIRRIAAAFDYEGPAATLVKQLKYGRQPYLAEGAGSFLTAQFIRLEWPMPDFIIPMPMAPLRKFDRGYNQSQLLAEVTGRMLNRPILNVLKRASGDFSQAGLSHKQRLQLSEHAITLKPTDKLRDKCLLLIDDVMTTGSTMRRCSDALAGGYPDSIYAITLCRAL